MIFVLVHGAFHGGWCWKRVAIKLRGRECEVFSPTLTGLGERKHLLRPEVGLDTHIQDVVAVFEAEDLDEVVLVGHSYAGLVIAGVANQLGDRIAHLVFLDALLPENGKSFLDLTDPMIAEQFRELARTRGDGWKVSPAWTAEILGVKDAADQKWLDAHMSAQSLATFSQPVRLTRGWGRSLRKTYIHCNQLPTAPHFAAMAQKAQKKGYQCLEIPTTHEAMITAPSELATALHRVGSAVD